MPSTKTKIFDCVEMKNRIQAERFAEYEAHKNEFTSYLDFINSRVKDSELMKVVREKANRPRQTG
ncbi:MAG: hypothetical protein ABFC96_05350 [Thermoguttaceae bacterium]